MKCSRTTILACLSLFAVNINVAVLADETIREFHEFQKFKEAKINAEGVASVETQGGGRRHTIFGAATDKFESSVELAKSKSSVINRGVGDLKRSIDDVQDLLNLPRNVKNNVEDLADVLDSLGHILKVVGYIPYVKPVVTPIGAAVRRFKNPVNKAERQLKKLANRMKPYVAKTNMVESKVNLLRRGISKVMIAETKLLETVKLSETSYPQIEKARDSITGSMTPAVDNFNGLQSEINGVVQSTLSNTESLRSALSGLSELARGIDEVTDALGPVKDPLVELKKALDYEVCLGFFGCYSVSDVLNNPVLSIFNELVSAILDPILGSIPIPGLPTDIPGLDAIYHLEDVLTEVERSLDNAISYFTKTAANVIETELKFTQWDKKIANLRP